ncbi:MAG TPA: hypothetical protein VFF27_00135 [Bacteroidia bacterium]|jgi:hypothetical protein|nr:hypothetical protein [Bacteroidia bacterium]
MKRFKLNEKEFNCPQSWAEITIEQLLKITAEVLKPMDAIVICTGITESEWNLSDDFKLIEEIEQTLSFLNSNEGCQLEKEPKEIVFNQFTMPPISDIGTKSIAQYQDIKLLINEFHLAEGEQIDTLRRLSLYPKIVATYLQPIIDKGEYDYKRADEIAKELYNHSAMEVSSWGYFFIQRFLELRNGIVKDVQTLGMKQKKQKQGSLSSLRRWVGEVFSIRLGDRTLRSTMK